MRLSGNTVLITGGGSGIGLGLAERFLRAGSEVVICGRREEKLREAKERLPRLHVRAADLADESARVAFAEWAVREHPSLNVLVNNAGIQVHLPGTEPSHWESFRDEIAINFEAPIQLALLLLPHLRRQARAAIVNVTSGLSFAPLARVPVYSATKAALCTRSRSRCATTSRTRTSRSSRSSRRRWTPTWGAGAHLRREGRGVPGRRPARGSRTGRARGSPTGSRRGEPGLARGARHAVGGMNRGVR
jgi:NADP-dependent 3-hydroxy acid dehydrogenase YdfG